MHHGNHRLSQPKVYLFYGLHFYFSHQLYQELVFQFLLSQMKLQNVMTLNGHTGICITPGYSFKVVRALITNFHQPQSTLLLLIAAIVGKRWKDIYEDALLNRYRFLSYGDGSILFLEN